VLPRSIRRALRFFLPLLLVASQAAPAGVVLCVDGGDHRRVETVAFSRCHANVADECSPDCRDTPLNEGPAIRTSNDAHEALAAAIAPAAAVVAASASDRGASRLLASPLRAGPPFGVALRSPILRC